MPLHDSPPRAIYWARARAASLLRPWRLAALFVGIVLPLWLAFELAEDIVDRETLRLDEPILLALHARANPVLNAIAVAVTEAGGFIGTLVIGLVAAWKLRALQRWRALFFWGVSLAGAGLLNMVTKLFFQRERPALWESLSPEHDFSFPSGHSTLSAALGAAVLLLLWPTRARPFAIAFAILWPLAVGSSRVYLGAHFPSDVAAGWCAGVSWTVGVYLILRGERDRFLRRPEPAQVLEEPAAPPPHES